MRTNVNRLNRVPEHYVQLSSCYTERNVNPYIWNVSVSHTIHSCWTKRNETQRETKHREKARQRDRERHLARERSRPHPATEVARCTVYTHQTPPPSTNRKRCAAAPLCLCFESSRSTIIVGIDMGVSFVWNVLETERHSKVYFQKCWGCTRSFSLVQVMKGSEIKDIHIAY